jgi:hypothetical protein
VADQHAVHAIAIHVHNLEPVITPPEHVAGPGNLTQGEHGEAANRVNVLAVFFVEEVRSVQRSSGRVEIEAAVDEPASIFAPDDCGLFVGFRRQVADDRRDLSAYGKE